MEYKAVFSSQLSYDQAQAFCNETGSERLAEVFSLEDNSLLYFLAKKRNQEESAGVSSFMIGNASYEFARNLQFTLIW